MSASHHENKVAQTGKDHAVQVNHDTAAQCGNCSAIVQGKYCHGCGQSAHVHHSLPHMLEEAVHGLWHFDAKGWRTIPLLIAFPGQLTRRYIDGQRVRFISPLGLFLFMVFFMFFVFSFSKEDNFKINGPGTADIKAGLTKNLQTDIDKMNAEIAKAQTNLDNAKKAGKNTEDEQNDLDTAIADKKVLEENFQRMSGIADQVSSTKSASDDNPLKVSLSGAYGQKLKVAMKHARENPELWFYKMKSYAYKFALILVPLSLPFLWVVFIGKKNITMFDHTVFTLYSLSFMALLISIMSILFYFGWDGTGVMVMMVVPPIHMFRQLKWTYGLTNLGSLWRTLFLCAAACFMMVIFLLLVATLSIS